MQQGLVMSNVFWIVCQEKMRLEKPAGKGNGRVCYVQDPKAKGTEGRILEG